MKNPVYEQWVPCYDSRNGAKIKVRTVSQSLH